MMTGMKHAGNGSNGSGEDARTSSAASGLYGVRSTGVKLCFSVETDACFSARRSGRRPDGLGEVRRKTLASLRGANDARRRANEGLELIVVDVAVDAKVLETVQIADGVRAMGATMTKRRRGVGGNVGMREGTSSHFSRVLMFLGGAS